RSSATYSAINAGRDTSVCSGSSVKLNATPGACIYNWTPSSTLDDDTLQTPTASPTVTTTYTLIYTVAGCSVTDTSHVVVTVGSSLTVNAGNDVTICNGVGVTLGASGGNTFSWSPAAGLSSSTISNPVANPTTTTTYTVTSSNGSCSGQDAVVVNVG